MRNISVDRSRGGRSLSFKSSKLSQSGHENRQLTDFQKAVGCVYDNNLEELKRLVVNYAFDVKVPGENDFTILMVATHCLSTAELNEEDENKMMGILKYIIEELTENEESNYIGAREEIIRKLDTISDLEQMIEDEKKKN